MASSNTTTSKSFLKAAVLLIAVASFCSTSTTPKPAAPTASSKTTATISHCEVGHCMDCSSSHKCTLCKSHLLTSRGECAGKASISNCLSSSATECVTCKPGHLTQLNASGSITACTSGVTVEHCYNAEQKSGGKQVCVDCKTGYYLDGTTGTCQKIKTEVSHCFTYKSANSCKVCKHGYVTKIHGTSDLSIDCDSKVAHEGEFAYCNTIKGGKCVSCDSHDEKYAVGYDSAKGMIKCGKGGKPATKGSMRLLISSGLVSIALLFMAM